MIYSTADPEWVQCSSWAWSTPASEESSSSSGSTLSSSWSEPCPVNSGPWWIMKAATGRVNNSNFNLMYCQFIISFAYLSFASSSSISPSSDSPPCPNPPPNMIFCILFLAATVVGGGALPLRLLSTIIASLPLNKSLFCEMFSICLRIKGKAFWNLLLEGKKKIQLDPVK